VIVNAVNPGYCYSNIRKALPFVWRKFTEITDFFLARPTEVGSSILVWAAIAGHKQERDDEFLDRLRGAYVSDWQVMETSDFVLSEKGAVVQHRIWVCHSLQNVVVNSNAGLRMRQLMFCPEPIRE
jgi:retinol dehydrogenase 12